MASAASMAPTNPLVSINPNALSGIDPPLLGSTPGCQNACSHAKSQSGHQLARRAPGSISWSMADRPVVIVSDAHLGHAPPEATQAFHRFLDLVPQLGGHLVING